MDYSVSNHHILIWLWFIIYAVSVIFLVPDSYQNQAVLKTVEANNKN